MAEELPQKKTIHLNGRQIEIPEEVALTRAVELLGVSRRTVTQYMDGGQLEWRDIAPIKSSRPTFRLKLESVMKLRMNYQVGEVYPPLAPVKRRPAQRPEGFGTIRHVVVGKR